MHAPKGWQVWIKLQAWKREAGTVLGKSPLRTVRAAHVHIARVAAKNFRTMKNLLTSLSLKKIPQFDLIPKDVIRHSYCITNYRSYIT